MLYILGLIRIRGSMPLTNGSGSGSGSWIPSRCQPKTYVLTQFFLLIRYFLKLHIHHFSKIKSLNDSQNSRNKGFSYFFCTMIEGSGSGFRAGSGSGSIPLTSGSGSGRHKNMWIRLILIRIRIRIWNTENYSLALKLTEFKTCSISKTGYSKLCRSDRIRIHKTGKISLDIQL
jgi:hypothetical protein